MGCCIAVALIIALVRRAWFALVPGASPSDVRFAPVARRAADGSVPHRPQPEAAQPGPVSRTSICLGAAAVSTAFYAGVVAVLRLLGVAHPMPGAAVSWTERDLIVGAIGVCLIVAAACLYRGEGVRGGRGPVLFGAGAAFFALGVLDMHVFGIVDLEGRSMLTDVLFHGPGLLAMALGAGAFAGDLRRQAATDLAAVSR